MMQIRPPVQDALDHVIKNDECELYVDLIQIGPAMISKYFKSKYNRYELGLLGRNIEPDHPVKGLLKGALNYFNPGPELTIEEIVESDLYQETCETIGNIWTEIKNVEWRTGVPAFSKYIEFGLDRCFPHWMKDKLDGLTKEQKMDYMSYLEKWLAKHTSFENKKRVLEA